MRRLPFLVAGAATASLGAELKREVAGYRALNFADSTKKTYQTHLNSYLQFCDSMNILPVPASEQTVAQYAAFLARRIKPASVKQYLNIIRILHLECGEQHPYRDSWYVKTTLKGIDKCMGCPPTRKTPITPEVLLSIRKELNFLYAEDCVFWAACLVLFFGLLRKSNLFQDDGTFDPTKQLTRDSFLMTEHDCVTIVVTWSKTIQRKEKTLAIRLPVLLDHPLCPVTAVTAMFRILGAAPSKSQAFPLKGSKFNKRLRLVTAAAAGNFSSHSFRRGGATWAMSCGVPGEIVKLMGDWASTCYLRYLDQIPNNIIDKYRSLFSDKLPKH